MKNLNKVLAMLVVFMMVVSTVAFASTFSDVAETSSYSTAIKVGVDLNLFKGYEDGTFAPDGEITRGEFAAIVVRMKGQESQAEGAKASTMFSDVPADHWAAGYVNIAVQAGIINGYGDGTFGPEDQVEYQDAITMMVRALGYEPAIGSAGYPTGYLTKAGDLGLTKGVNGTNGVAINRGAVAQIAFNALDVPLMTQSGYGTFTQYVINDGYSSTNGTTNVKKTILSENHDIVKVQGIIESSTDSTSASTTASDKVNVDVTNALYNKFAIDDRSMEVGTSDALNFVGKKCIIFVEYDEFEDTCTIASLYEAAASDSLTINLSDIEKVVEPTSSDNGSVQYYSTDDKTTTVSIAANAKLYYNGVADAKNIPTWSELYDMNGSVELALLDSQNTNADYDTVYITAYNTFVVDEVRTSAARVSSKIDDGLTRIEYDETDGDIKATLVDANGAAMDWADLQEFDVLMVKWAETSAKNIYDAYIVDNSVSGTVTEISGDKGDDRTVVIGGKEYDVAVSAESDKDIKLGDEGKYYLDANDKVIYVDTTSTRSDNYGYVVAVGSPSATDLVQTYQLKLVTKDNALVIYDVAKKIKYGAVNAKGKYETLSNQSTTDDISAEIDALEDTVITYKLNSSDQISAIYTADDKNEDEFSEFYADVTMDAYDAEDMSFKVSSKRLYLGSNTIIFNVGDISKGADPEDTEVVALANLTDDQKLDGATIYDVDDDDVIGCVVLRADNEIDAANDYATFVTKVTASQDANGDDITYVRGYNGLDEITYTCDADDVSENEVAVGTLVVPKYNANGTVKEFKVVAGNEGAEVTTGFGTDKAAMSGTVTYLDGKKSYIYLDGTAGMEDGTAYKIKSTTNVYVYDETTSARTKYKVDESMSYLDYTEEYGIYVGKDKTKLNVTAYLFIDDGNVVDLLYYINK